MRLSKKIIFVDKLKDFLAPLFSFVKHSETKLGGQSTIEYSMVVMLVMAGIIVLGPYVIRSVNAHFKMWEDTTEEAFTDPLKDRDPEGLPKPQCRCPVKATGCGLGSCQPTEMLWQKDCVPLDCEPQETRCEVENGCCGEEVGGCGGACAAGEREVKVTCGKLPTQTACRASADCGRCTGVPIENADPCPGDEVDVVGEVPRVPVPNGGCSVPPEAIKCEAECKVGFVLQNGACVQPVCEPAYTVIAAGAGGSGCTPPAVGYTKPYPAGVCIDAGDDNPCCVIRCNPGDQRTSFRKWCVGQCHNWVGGPVDPDGCYVYEGGGNRGAPWCEITCQKPCP